MTSIWAATTAIATTIASLTTTPTPGALPTAYPGPAVFTPVFGATSGVPILNTTFTPPASCLSDPTLTWDVSRFPTPTILVLDQFYRALVEQDGAAMSTTTVGYECFPPSYSWEPYDTPYYSPGVCPSGYYQASTSSTTTWLGGNSTRTTFQGQCCPTSYTAYYETGCFSNLLTHNAPIVGINFATGTAMISSSTVTYIVANTSVPAFPVSALAARFPKMTDQVQVIRPAVVIKYGDGSPEPDDDFEIPDIITKAMRLRTILFIAVPVGVVVFLIAMFILACIRRRRG